MNGVGNLLDFFDLLPNVVDQLGSACQTGHQLVGSEVEFIQDVVVDRPMGFFSVIPLRLGYFDCKGGVIDFEDGVREDDDLGEEELLVHYCLVDLVGQGVDGLSNVVMELFR